jgi:hypothetical protein
MTKKILTDAFVSGIVLVVVGMLMHLVASKFMKHDMNNNVVLATHFFLIGVVVRLLSEYSGIKYSS